MGKVALRLEEQFLSDSRSAEAAYTLKIENTDSTRLELLALNYRIPPGVEHLETKNPTFVALKAKHKNLCCELENLINNNLLESSEETKDRLIKSVNESFRLSLGVPNWILSIPLFHLAEPILLILLRFYYQPLQIMLREMVKVKFEESNRAYLIQIKDSKQAQEAFTRWSSKLDDFGKNLFESKLPYLIELDDKIKANKGSTAIATIEPESFFAQTYIFKFPRNRWEPKKYSIGFEVTYLDSEQNKQCISGVSSSLVITPKPVQLSCIAVLASTLGATLKYFISVPKEQLIMPLTTEQIYNAAQSQITIGYIINVLSAAIIAFVVFNVYEHIDITKKIGIGVGWRSALLVGFLCGLFQERIVAALNALVGL